MGKNEIIISLVKELIDDIELYRISGEQLLLKTKRLLRLNPNLDIEKWIDYELKGYKSSELGKEYMTKTGRWINKEKGEGYWMPLAQVEASIDAQKIKLSCIRTPDLSGDNALVVTRDVIASINAIGNYISTLSGIKSRVLSYLHDYVSEVYYKITLENVIESIFESYKEDIDEKITTESKDVIEMLPSVMNRLIENDKESISQALLTCRRIIDTFSNFIFPATDETVTIDGNELSLTQDKVKNRINAYINDKIDSKSRKKRLRQNLSNLYERVSSGVHDEVTSEEARALVFNTYLIVGEILSLQSHDTTTHNSE
jgi:hypothetical protein